jgi:hypothetical protein
MRDCGQAISVPPDGETTHPRFTHAVRHALPAIAGWVNRWTGDVFGVYPLYDVYDNLHRHFRAQAEI